MALEQSDRAAKLTQQQNVIANIVLEINDPAFPEVFGTVGVNKTLRIGEFVIGDGSLIGGVKEDENSRPWIQRSGTTSNISQKVDTDKPGGASSISTFRVNMLDKDNRLTKMFSPGERVPDILGLKATAYWMPANGAHPEDSTPVFRGIISTIDYGPGNVSLIIDSPEQLKRQDLLVQYNSNTTAAINDVVTTIPMETTDGLVESFDSLTSYIRIDDEIIEVGSISGDDFIGCTRGALDTIAVGHDDESEAQSFYNLTEFSPVDLTLKLMISGIGVFGESTGNRINQINPSLFIQNTVFIKDEFFQGDTGLVPGDLITITGAANAANNVVDRDIVSFTTIEDGTIIQLSGTDMIAEGIGFTMTFKSKYDTLNFGCAINPFHVDVERFELIKDLVGIQHPDFNGFIKDTIQARDFIDQEILWAAGMFGLFRQGRISVGANLPPLSSQNTKTLNADTVKKAATIKVRRSFKQYFYNAIVYKFQRDTLTDRFLAGRITQSSDSTNRINVGNKALTIESIGINNTAINRNKLDVLARRALDRYQYGAERLDVSTNFKTGFTIEVGDSVVLEGASLKISDSRSASRDYIPRVLEVVNKSFSLLSGDIKLSVIDSVFGANGRYGVVSPASKLKSGSTTTILNLERSFGTVPGLSESVKWQDYIGQRIQVRSPDFSFQEIVTFTSILPSDPSKISISPALSVAPLVDYIVESPNYDDTSDKIDPLYKGQHVYPAKEIAIVSGVSTTQFNLSVPDAANLVIGDTCLVHSVDYSDEIEVGITNNVAGLITVEDMGFTPDNTYGVIPINFLDTSFVYRAF